MSIMRTHKPTIANELPSVEYTRSAWMVEWGSFRMGRYRIVQRTAERVAQNPPPTDRSWVCRNMAGPVTAALAVVALPVILTQASAALDAPYVVSQKIPAAAVRPIAAPHSARLPRIRRDLKRMAARKVLPATPTTEAGLETAFSGGQAIAAAWRTGEAQEWDENGSHGIIVPGPAEESEGYRCRSITRLTRRIGQEDAVEQLRRCSRV